MAGETYWRCTKCGVVGIHGKPDASDWHCKPGFPFEPVAVLPVEELAALRRLRDFVLKERTDAADWVDDCGEFVKLAKEVAP